MAKRNKGKITPYDLPHLRDQMIELSEFLSVENPIENDPLPTFARELERSEMTWVSRDMTKLAQAAAETLPEWTPAEVMPHKSGLLIWGGETGCSVTVEGHCLRAVGVTWYVRRDGALIVNTLTDVPPPNAERTPVNSRIRSAASMTLDPTREGSSLVDGPWADEHGLESEAAARESGAMLALLGATWLLAEQDGVSDREVVKTTPTKRRRFERSALTRMLPTNVQLIELRRHETVKPSGQRRAVEWSSRWLVGGHWRQQPYGPGRKQRRPVYIAPYIKGPDDKPLKSERVNVWRK